MPLHIINKDISTIKTDILLIPTNEAYIDEEKNIQDASEISELNGLRKKYGREKLGSMVLSKSPFKNIDTILYIVLPSWQDNTIETRKTLYDIYTNALHHVNQKNIQTIAIPIAPVVELGFSFRLATGIIYDAINDFLYHHDIDITLVVNDSLSFLISMKILVQLQSFLQNTYHKRDRYQTRIVENRFEVADYAKHPLMDDLEESFAVCLMRLIDEKGLTDVEVYKRANISRKLFSKIRSNRNYQPSKATALAFTLALKLNLQQTNDLLSKAGFILSRSSKFDIVIEFFIERSIFDIYQINVALYEMKLPLLGKN